MVFVTRVDRTPTENIKKKKTNKQGEESFSDSLDSILGVEAVELEIDKEKRDQNFEKSDSDKKLEDDQPEVKKTNNNSLLDIEV